MLLLLLLLLLLLIYWWIDLFYFHIAGWLVWSWCSGQATGWNDVRLYLKLGLSNHANSIQNLYRMPVRWKNRPGPVRVRHKKKSTSQRKILFIHVATCYVDIVCTKYMAFLYATVRCKYCKSEILLACFELILFVKTKDI